PRRVSLGQLKAQRPAAPLPRYVPCGARIRLSCFHLASQWPRRDHIVVSRQSPHGGGWPMKILFINQFFWPDAAATGQFLEDLVRHLGANGHEITVIASGNRYADAAALSDAPPARILHVHGVPFARSISGRALSYLSFYAGAFWKALRCPRPDVVITMTTPPLLSVIGEILRRFRGVRHFIWEMDLFPDAFVSLEAMREGGWADRAMGAIADYCRRRTQSIIALGPCMEARLLKRGIPRERIHIADNWADGSEITPLPPRNAADIHILYSGNL